MKLELMTNRQCTVNSLVPGFWVQSAKWWYLICRILFFYAVSPKNSKSLRRNSKRAETNAVCASFVAPKGYSWFYSLTFCKPS
jgi:hypothetical protein